MWGPAAYLLVVLLQAAELLPQRLQLCLQVGPAERQLVQDLAQPVDVRLHALAQGQLRLVPERERKQEGAVSIRSHHLLFSALHCLPFLQPFPNQSPRMLREAV